MKFATVRDLKNQASAVLRDAAAGNDVLITSHGRPVAVLHGIKEGDLEDFVLSCHPELRESIEEAHRDYRSRGGIPLREFMKRAKGKGRTAGGHVPG